MNEELLLIDPPAEYAIPDALPAADAMNEAKEERNALYWKTRCLRVERLGTADNVETLRQGLERVLELARAARSQEDEAVQATLKEIRFFAQLALKATED